jgi:ferredoxin
MDNQPQQQADAEVQIGKYKVKVVRNLCISAAACIAVSPNVFEFDAENKAIIKNGANDTEQNILMAAQACPTKAIVITDAETGKQIWPA